MEAAAVASRCQGAAAGPRLELRLNPSIAPAYAAAVSHQSFVHPYRVTYRDCTIGNHVYYANYLGILEAARGEFFRHLGSTLLKWQEAGFMFPVVEAHLCYKALARYDDVLSIEVWVTSAERVNTAKALPLVRAALISSSNSTARFVHTAQ